MLEITYGYSLDGRQLPIIQKDNGNGTVTETPPRGSSDETILGDWTPGRYAWELDNIQLLPHPIYVKGHQGLWDFDMVVEAAEAAKDTFADFLIPAT